ncbi:PfkB family carbohydrate kinase, partial [Segatella copri]|uniref:PfkB family carbohydrate kinase n=1 Tax=Segatella copri TaxID=165179 RepID=UPI001F1DB666
LMRKFPPVFIERRSIVVPALEKQGEKIIVEGSMNMDVTMEVSRIPVNDETQLAEKMLVFPGGKGGNQAVGAGKLGGQVYMIGCLGNDMDGKQLYTSLVENHVHMDGVIFDPVVSSGKAYISVDKKGESTIVVYQGANRNLSISQINNCKYL